MQISRSRVVWPVTIRTVIALRHWPLESNSRSQYLPGFKAPRNVPLLRVFTTNAVRQLVVWKTTLAASGRMHAWHSGPLVRTTPATEPAMGSAVQPLMLAASIATGTSPNRALRFMLATGSIFMR